MTPQEERAVLERAAKVCDKEADVSRKAGDIGASYTARELAAAIRALPLTTDSAQERATDTPIEPTDPAIKSPAADTPRTEYIVANYRPYAGSPEAERSFDRMSHCSRQLERELAAANAELNSVNYNLAGYIEKLMQERKAREEQSAAESIYADGLRERAERAESSLAELRRLAQDFIDWPGKSADKALCAFLERTKK